MSSNPFESDPFAGWSDEDEHATHSGPEESDPFATDEPDTTDPDFEVVEDEDPNSPTAIVKAMTAEEWNALLDLYVLQKIVNNAIADYTGERKDAVDDILPLASKKFSTDQWKVRVPTVHDTDEHIATVSAKRTKKDAVEINSEADLIPWLEQNATDLVDVEEVPEKTVVTPAHTRKTIKKAHLGDLVERLGLNVTPDGDLVTPDGEPVPGLRFIPKDTYTGHMVSFGGKGNPMEKRGLELLTRGQIKGRTTADVVNVAAIEKGKGQ